MQINSVITCPTYYYYQGDQCNGYTTYSFRSVTAITASVVKITGDICVTNIVSGSSNTNEVISTHSTCNDCTGGGYDYYDVTQYLNCQQNSAVGQYSLRVPTNFSGTWYCGDDGYQYAFANVRMDQTYYATAVSSEVSCFLLSC